MLIKITQFRDLDAARLMAVYAESNFENTDYFFPEERDKEAAARQVEAGFLDFLRTDFFTRPGAACWVLAEGERWLSACRTCPVREGVLYLEALETRPDQRRKGYGSRLLGELTEALKREGPFRLCDCVGKKNAASLRTHEKCGFRIVSDPGFDYLQGEADERDFGLEYRWPEV